MQYVLRRTVHTQVFGPLRLRNRRNLLSLSRPNLAVAKNGSEIAVFWSTFIIIHRDCFHAYLLRATLTESLSITFKPATAFYRSSKPFPNFVRWKGRSCRSGRGRSGKHEPLPMSYSSPNYASSQRNKVRFVTGDSPYPDHLRKSKPRGSHPGGLASTSENPNGPEPQPVAGVAHQSPREHWKIQKEALKEKFGEQGWSPRKKLSPDTMEGIRALHEQYPRKYTTPVLADQFEVSPEAIRRILKSKWRPSPKKMEERRARWAKRHDRIWDAQAEMGLRPRRTKDRKPEGPEKLDDIIPSTSNLGP